jgi:hypothetical protein
LRRSQHRHDLAAWLPSFRFQDTDTHRTVLVEGHVGVVDSGLERDLGGLEWVVGWEDEEELEFAALEERIISIKNGL